MEFNLKQLGGKSPEKVLAQATARGESLRIIDREAPIPANDRAIPTTLKEWLPFADYVEIGGYVLKARTSPVGRRRA